MRQDGKPRTTWLDRLIRGWRPDRNPLRRRSDRIEAALLALLLAGVAAAMPFTWRAVAAWASEGARHEAMSQRAAMRQVPAVLLQDPVGPGTYGLAGLGVAEALVRWPGPGGRQITGLVLVPGGSLHKGAVTTIWVDRAGQQTAGPLPPREISARGELAALTSLAMLVMVAAGVGMLGRRVLDWRRLAGWDADWQVTAPRWTPHR